MWSYTKPSGKVILETAWKRVATSKKILGRWLEKSSVYHEITSTEKINSSIMMLSQLVNQSHIRSALLHIRYTLQFWYNKCQEHLHYILCCFKQKYTSLAGRHIDTNPVANSSSSNAGWATVFTQWHIAWTLLQTAIYYQQIIYTASV